MNEEKKRQPYYNTRMKITPSYLSKRDIVTIVAPAGKLPNRGSLDSAIQTLQFWGLEVQLGKYLFCQHHSFSGTDEERLSDLQNALDNPKIKAIFCARGGYGCNRIVDKIDFSAFQKSPKWLLGFSDITMLLSHINNLGFESIHCSMPNLFSAPKATKSVESIRKILFGKSWILESDLPHQFNKMGKASAEIVGGNLSILNNSLGTKSEINTKNKILFIEEVGEYIYHIDRMFTHLLRARKLEKLAALVIGQVSEIKENSNNPFGQSVEELIAEKLKDFNFPICFNFPIGHQAKNLPVICGRKATLEVNNQGGKITFAKS